MFVGNLNNSQQEVFLGLANDVIHADGVLEEKELELLAVLKMQTNEGVEAVSAELHQLASIFDTKESKVSAMIELVGLAYADNDIDAMELALIQDVAESMGISESELKDIDLWVSRQIALVAEAATMMFD